MASATLTVSGAGALNVLALSLHHPLNGAWSATVDLSADVAPAAGATCQLQLDGGAAMLGRVTSAALDGGRVRARVTGGALDWQQPIDLQHYRDTTADDVLAALGLRADIPTDIALPFWTRQATTIGDAVSALGRHMQVNWRVNPDGTLRMREESPAAVTPGGAEILRDGARGIVELAPDAANVVPGCQVGADLVGDVLYAVGNSDGAPLRCRYYTEARGMLRGALERLIRWVMRDTLYLGQYTAVVQRQAADGTLDLMPDDPRLGGAGGGLQGVPIRHGLPGVSVDVPSGVRVLLAFDAGDSRAPYAALWHSEQVTAVRIGGSDAVAMAGLSESALLALWDGIISSAGSVTAPGGGPAFVAALQAAKTAYQATLSVGSDVLHTR